MSRKKTRNNRKRGSGSIRRRGDRYQVSYRLPVAANGVRPPERSASFNSEGEAEQWLRDRLNEVERGEHIRDTKKTVAAYCAGYLKLALDKEDIAPTTHEGYRQILTDHVAPRIGHIPLANLKPLDLDRLYADLLKNGRKRATASGARALSKSRVHQVHAFLHKAFRLAVRDGYMRSNPADQVDAPQPIQNDTLESMLAPDELDVLIEAARNSKHRIPVLLTALAGLRRGEVLGLRRDAIDFENGVIYVHQTLQQVGSGEPYFTTTKSKKTSVVPMPEELADALGQHLKAQAKNRLRYGAEYRVDLDLVVFGRDGAPIRPNSFSPAFIAEMGRLFKAKHISHHKLRGGYATMLHSEGASMQTARALLGHSSTSVTERYAKAVSADIANAVASLDARRKRKAG
jgi:integrase